MKKKKKEKEKASRQAKGCAVIIDVFRAFTVEAYLINNGATKVILKCSPAPN